MKTNLFVIGLLSAVLMAEKTSAVKIFEKLRDDDEEEPQKKADEVDSIMERYEKEEK